MVYREPVLHVPFPVGVVVAPLADEVGADGVVVAALVGAAYAGGVRAGVLNRCLQVHYYLCHKLVYCPVRHIAVGAVDYRTTCMHTVSHRKRHYPVHHRGYMAMGHCSHTIRTLIAQ